MYWWIKQQEIGERAFKIYQKRMRGEIPYEIIDRFLRDNGIIPNTQAAKDFMKAWDWDEATRNMRKEREVKCGHCDEHGECISDIAKCTECGGSGVGRYVVGFRPSSNMLHDGEIAVAEDGVCVSCGGSGKWRFICCFCNGYRFLYDYDEERFLVAGPKVGGDNWYREKPEYDSGRKVVFRFKKDNIKSR